MAVTVSIDQLGVALKGRRTAEKLSLREIEAETDISAATLSRIERGHLPDTAVIAKLADWLGVNVRTAGGEVSEVKTDEDLMNQIAVHLRANRRLPEDVATAIAATFKAVMEHEIRSAKSRKER